MHLACAYLEGKSVHPITRADLESSQVPDMPSVSGTQANMSMDESEPSEAAEASTSGEHSCLSTCSTILFCDLSLSLGL